jgi:hypothetical protein
LSILVENELDAVVNELAEASFLVTRVEKDPLSLVNELADASFLVTLVEKEDDASVKLPLILTAVKLLINDLLAPNDPLIRAAVKFLITEAFEPSEPLIADAN